MKHLIDTFFSNIMLEKATEPQVKYRIEAEAKRLIGNELFSSVAFVEKTEFHGKRYSGELYTLTKEQVEYIEAMLSLVPNVKSEIMNEIFNK